MSGDLIVTNKTVDVYVEFTEEHESARAPGWYRAECTLCDDYATGTSPVVEDWAYDHVVTCPELHPLAKGEKRDAYPHPGQRVVEELRFLARQRAVIDEAERQYVTHARRAGCSWTMIAEALGITRDEAYDRHA